MAHMKL